MLQSTAMDAPRPWPRVKWTRAGQVTGLLGEHAPAIPAELPPAIAFAQVRAVQPALAARFMAHALPRIDAARWLAACLALDERPAAPAQAAADKAVRRWVANPSDEARRLAYAAGEAAGFTTVQGLACLAIFLSGGSITPPEQAVPVNPAPGTFGQVAGSVVVLAAYARGPLAFAARIGTMLDLADRLAAGEDVPA